MKPPINQQVEQTVAALSKNTPTPAGPATSDSPLPQQALVEAIGQLFAEFELVFHNQYNKAFGNAEKLGYAKRLWYSHLKAFSAETILAASKLATRESEYLPTVHTMLDCCERVLADKGIPTPRKAYIEACNARAPKNGYNWSHPAVYFAGRDTGWQYLHETPERNAFPVFSENYVKWRAKAQQGEELLIELPAPKTPPAPRPRPSKEEKQYKLKSLRDELGL